MPSQESTGAAGGSTGSPPPRLPRPPPTNPQLDGGPPAETRPGGSGALQPLDLGMTSEIYNMARLQRTRESYNKVLYKLRNNIALIATLIATFTYVAGNNPPGGVHQDGALRGTAIAAKRAAFRVFFVFNNLALFTSLSVVLILLSSDIVSYTREILNKLIMGAHVAIWAAIYFAAAAYAAASVVIMGPPPGIGWATIFVFCVCGVSLGSVFVIAVIAPKNNRQSDGGLPAGTGPGGRGAQRPIALGMSSETNNIERLQKPTESTPPAASTRTAP